MIKRFFNSQTKTITFAALILGISSLLSGLLGLIRDRLLAGKFGAGDELDVYFTAFRIPDFIYGILIVGGITAAFLPIFAEYFKKDEKEAWEFTNNVLNCFLFFLIVLCAVLAVLAPLLIHFIAPGFASGKKELTVALTRILFLSPIFFGLSNIFADVLQYFNKFLVYAIAPLLYNLGIIFGILFFVPRFGLQGLAFGVILGAALYWLLQIPAAVGSGYKYRPVFNLKHEGLIRVFKLMIPRVIGSAAYNINLIVITAIGSLLAAGSIAIFNFSNNLQYFPVGIVGIAFATAAFPVLSRAWVDGSKEKFLEHFSASFRQILFLIVPLSLLMFILRAQIVRLILGTGQFGWLETRLTAASLGIFSLGIFASTFIPFLAYNFYSFKNTKTPVLISLVSMALNIGLSFLFVFLLGFSNSFQEFLIHVLKLQGIKNIQVLGLPLAVSLSAIFQFFLLICFLKRQISDIKSKEIFDSLKKIVFATILMGLATYFTLNLVSHFVFINTVFGLLVQTVLAFLAAFTVYFVASHFLASPEIKLIKDSIIKQFTKTNGEHS